MSRGRDGGATCHSALTATIAAIETTVYQPESATFARKKWDSRELCGIFECELPVEFLPPPTYRGLGGVHEQVRNGTKRYEHSSRYRE